MYLVPLFNCNKACKLRHDGIILADVDDVRLAVSLHNLREEREGGREGGQIATSLGCVYICTYVRTSCSIRLLSRDPSVQSLMIALAVSWCRVCSAVGSIDHMTYIQLIT